MKVSVVITTYNRGPLIARTLPTVFAQAFPLEAYEVIVVVDGSTDGTLELVHNVKPRCTFRIFEQPNGGLAAARNVGLRAARGDLVLFLDDDMRCDPILLREHVAAHRGSDPCVVLGLNLVAPESPHTLATDYTRAYVQKQANRLARDMEPQWPHDMDVLPNSSTPRSILIACGGFDESFYLGREDTELGFRLWKMGVQFRYYPKAVAYQVYIKSASDIVRIDGKWNGRSEVLLCRKHPEFRPHVLVAQLGVGALWKKAARECAVRLPASPDPLLRLPCWAAERLCWVPQIKRTGIWVLGVRRQIAMFRSALNELGSWKAVRAEFGMKLPVLLYHRVGPPRVDTHPELTIGPEQFERQVQWLAARGYVGIRPSDWLTWRREGRPLPDKPVLLTFDDAYADITKHALPVLQRYGFGAAVFVITGHVGGTTAWDGARLMTAKDIREWAGRGIEFGAHSRTHADLTSLHEPELAQEITGSGNELTDILGTRVISFTYPYGFHNEAVRTCTQGGFDLAFTTEEGLNDLGTNPYVLRRTMVRPGDSLIDLACRVRLGWSPLVQLRARLALRTRAARAKRFLFG